MIKIRRGLDLPITGAPRQSIEDGPNIRSVAVIGFDYHGMKPTMAVQQGDKVKKGQLLFTDKKTEGVRYTAPAAGTISAINRGARRVLQSVVIDIEGSESEAFAKYAPSELSKLSREKVVENLSSSGLWTAVRTRPYSKVPATNAQADNIFVSVMDTNPLAADPTVVIAEKPDAFIHGLTVLSRLTEGCVYLCQAEGAKVPSADIENLVVESFAGSQVDDPRLVKTVLGASLQELTAGQITPGDQRIISGSVFGGRNAYGPTAYLGRYHVQVSVLEEGRERPFIHYLTPGANRFSALPIYLSKFLGGKKFNFTTSANGSERAMVPIGAYERVMPLDILPTQLLRSLIVGDTDMAQKLGCLELDEEDLALCTFVCSGKYEYGPILRDNLTRIEKEG